MVEADMREIVQLPSGVEFAPNLEHSLIARRAALMNGACSSVSFLPPLEAFQPVLWAFNLLLRTRVNGRRKLPGDIVAWLPTSFAKLLGQ
jgi:hypothetical protein